VGKVFTYIKRNVILLPEGEEHRHQPKVLTEKAQFFAVKNELK